MARTEQAEDRIQDKVTLVLINCICGHVEAGRQQGATPAQLE